MYVHVCVCTCMCVYMYVCVHVCVCALACAFVLSVVLLKKLWDKLNCALFSQTPGDKDALLGDRGK